MASPPKYLYLTRDEWASTWIDGGQIPLHLASTYRASERSGTKTPDEVVQRQLHGISYGDFGKVVRANPNGKGHFQLRVGKVVIGGQTKGQNVTFDQHESDGLILCLSNSCSTQIMERLEKVACVEIFDWQQLLNVIDAQLKVSGKGGVVSYTTTNDRNHFLKSDADQWQDEFRLFWPGATSTMITIPSGLARRVTVPA